MGIIKLEWVYKPATDVSYDTWYADTAIGRYTISAYEKELYHWYGALAHGKVKTKRAAFKAVQDDITRRTIECMAMIEGKHKESFQSRVSPWLDACFGEEIKNDKLERSDRFIEEAIELVQSANYPKERVLALVDYVYGRDIGELPQEVGGVMVTLAAFCLANGVDMHECGETELARVWTKIERIREKQAAKPTGSALPVALESA